MTSPRSSAKTDKPGRDTARAPRKPGVPRVMTERRLNNIAEFYIQRFATTAANLKRVLTRRCETARRAHGGEAAEMAGWVDAVVARMVRGGAVDDARYASGRAAALRRLGKGPGKIRALLSAKGVDRAMIEAVIAETAVTDSGKDAAFEAALAYAKRRRLGPFGKATGDADAQRKQKTKDMAALARAGFSYDVAKRIINNAPDDRDAE